jgi:RNA polymerase sigma-70 factor (ECF subfamily)
MKIIQLHKSEQKLIKQASKNSRKAQKELFEKYSSKMLSVARYYIKDVHAAEDVMISSFFKALTKLDKYKYEGSFEGWLRRIVVNDSISYLRKQKNIYCEEEYSLELQIHQYSNEIEQQYDLEEIQTHIDNLPKGYKMVFILFAVEGYKHKEIAKMLSISESTSKSQFFKARKLLQKNLLKQNSQSQTRVIN